MIITDQSHDLLSHLHIEASAGRVAYRLGDIEVSREDFNAILEFVRAHDFREAMFIDEISVAKLLDSVDGALRNIDEVLKEVLKERLPEDE